jgi:hypothetical protein
MEVIDDPEVLEAIKKLAEHFQSNVNNRFLRDILIHLEVSDSDWRMIERLTSPKRIDEIQGYGVEQLYDGIIALARFIYTARREAVPAIANFNPHGASTFMKMAINAFPANLATLSKMVLDLYRKMPDQAGEVVPGRHFEELGRVEHYLTG